MKTGFRDALEVKGEKPKAAPVDGKNTPWSYSMPDYDQRSSCFVNVGVDYGVGHTNPVGTEKASTKPAMPMGRVDTMKLKIGY